MAFFNLNAAVILRLANRFHKAHSQAARLLCEMGVIAFDTIHGMFCQWDENYGLVTRPKYDPVCRAVARSFRWRMPRGRLVGWDFKPLPAGFVAPEQIDLVERGEGADADAFEALCTFMTTEFKRQDENYETISVDYAACCY